MAEITYESIKPLIAKEEVHGSTMVCTFRCPESGFEVEARAPLHKKQTAGSRVASRAKDTVKRNLLFQARTALSRAIGGILGRGTLGQMGRSVGHSAVTEATRGGGSSEVSYSDAEKREAVVDAFQTVSSRFAYDAENERWISAQLAGDVLTDFARQLDDAPVNQTYDQGVLARMLAEVANADGTIGEDEKGFLGGFVPPDLGSVDDLLAKPALSTVELDETSAGEPRETMLMIAWALALTDEDLAEAEQARLGQLAEGLGIPPERADELKHHAQVFIIDQAVEAACDSGQDDAQVREQVLELADKIGLDRESAERAEIKYRKRVGRA